MINPVQFLISILFIWILCFMLECFSTDITSTLLYALPFIVTLAIFVDALDRLGLELGFIGSFFAGLIWVLIFINLLKDVVFS